MVDSNTNNQQRGRGKETEKAEFSIVLLRFSHTLRLPVCK